MRLLLHASVMLLAKLGKEASYPATACNIGATVTAQMLRRTGLAEALQQDPSALQCNRPVETQPYLPAKHGVVSLGRQDSQ